MAATLQAQYFGASASEPAGANAESGIKFNREDTQSGTTPIPIPTATGTKYSWIKNIALAVTGTAATSISNRNVFQASTPTTGLFLFWKATNTYAQAASGNQPTDSGSNGATPSGYTAMTGSAAVYDNASVSAGSTGRNGQFCVMVCGVDNTFAGGAGSATALPNIKLQYDES